MPCGSDNVIVMSQWTPDGHYQESTDGGTTWHDAPNHDPRRNVPLPPPFLPPDTVDETCTYADSIVNTLINNWINATGATEDEATVIEGIISFLAGIFGAFGVVAAAITLGIAILIVAFTVAAWKAAFVSDVWDRLRCNLKENMGADGTFTQDQVDSVYDRIQTEETGIVAISLAQMVAALGTQGLTIAARAGRGAADADCDCEDCNCPFEDWITFGTFVECSDNRVVISSLDDGGGHQAVYLGYGGGNTYDVDKGRIIDHYNVISGSVATTGWNAVHTGTLSFVGVGGCAAQQFWQDNSPFTVEVFYDDCETDCG